jgi:hypothetical protein
VAESPQERFDTGGNLCGGAFKLPELKEPVLLRVPLIVSDLFAFDCGLGKGEL